MGVDKGPWEAGIVRLPVMAHGRFGPARGSPAECRWWCLHGGTTTGIFWFASVQGTVQHMGTLVHESSAPYGSTISGLPSSGPHGLPDFQASMLPSVLQREGAKWEGLAVAVPGSRQAGWTAAAAFLVCQAAAVGWLGISQGTNPLRASAYRN